MVANAVRARFMNSQSNVNHTAITGQNPVQAFQAWMDETLRQVVLGYDGTWTGKYVAEGAAVGVQRAQRLVPLGSPRNRTPVVQSITVTELQGIIEAVSQQAVRAFGTGLLTSQSAPAVARSINSVMDRVGRTRSRALAEFMVVRAHAAATLDVFRAGGVALVGTRAEGGPHQARVAHDAKKKKWAEPDDLVEVLTAGDDLVCPVCEDISDEGPYTLDDAEGLIPAHPNCRCAFVPADDARFASVHDHIVKLKSGKYRLLSHTGKNLGTFESHAAAAKHEGEVEYFKARDSRRLTRVTGDAGPDDEPRDAHGMWSSLGGAAIKSWSPPHDWHGVEGQDHEIDEPALPTLKKGQHLSSGVIMREADGRTWLVKPTNGFGGYNYTFPKGTVEDDMHPQANAIKEMWEETGLKARITGYAGDYRGDTSVTRMYHAVREGGHPKDKGWETEQVALAHPDDLGDMLNRSRDRKIAVHHIIKDDFNPDEPRDYHGQWTSGGGSEPATIDMDLMSKVGSKMGSNEGGTYESPVDDSKYYVKKPATKDHVTNELLAAKLYQLAGANTMTYVPVKGGEHVATVLEPLTKNNVSQFSLIQRVKAQDDFAVHAWLANWDAVGTGGDNQVVVQGSNRTATVDVGGSLKYRAQGTPKGADFGDVVNETNTLRDPSKAPDAAKLFGDMSNDQIKASIARVTSIPDHKIVETVTSNGGDMELAMQMVHRKVDLAAQAEKMSWSTAPKTILGPNTSATPAVSDHPAKALLSQVKGTSAERVAWRKQLDSAPSLVAKKDLQHKIIASFWKQHGKLTGEKQTEIAAKTAQYSKKYGMANPLTAPVSTPQFKTAQTIVSVPSKVFGQAAPASGAATQAELEKAKKNQKLQLQYVPGAPDGHPEAQKLVDDFNAKYEGKSLSESELHGKVADFKKLQSDMIPLMSEQQKSQHAAAIVAKAEQDAKIAKAKAAEEAKLNDPETKKHYEVLKGIGLHPDQFGKGIDSIIKKHDLAITPQQGAYIRAYVGSHYGPVNAQLRKGVLTMAQHQYADALNDALAKMPVYEGNVERGAHLDEAAFQKYKDAVGGVAVEHQFTSAGVAQKLWGSHTFHIKSKSAADIRAFNPGEGGGEVVFQAGSKFHVTKVDVPSKQIWMEQL